MTDLKISFDLENRIRPATDEDVYRADQPEKPLSFTEFYERYFPNMDKATVRQMERTFKSTQAFLRKGLKIPNKKKSVRKKKPPVKRFTRYDIALNKHVKGGGDLRSARRPRRPGKSKRVS